VSRLVVLLNAYAANQAGRLRANLTTQWDVHTVVESDAENARARALHAAEAIVTSRFSAPVPVTPRLRLLQTPTAGFDRIELAAVPKDCVVCNVHEHESAIAEYVFAAMLQWVIRLTDLDRLFRAGDWTGGVAKSGHVHREIGGRTLGIIGYGRIGKEVARRAKAFGMQVVAATRSPREGDHVDKLTSMESLDALLPQCDFVLVACSLNKGTRGLIDARRLALLKGEAVLINVSRAAIVDEAALFAALKEGRIGGAILDVWYSYPSVDEPDAKPSRFPFERLDNVIMTPHASGWTEEAVDRRWRFIASNLDRLARGEKLENVIIEHGRFAFDI
jgi:phosphoglycerate dehydrogenase-like enzyme